jgi:predicted Zn-dependent protease
MAVLQSRQGNYDRATEYFERALRSNETCNPLARYFFGTMLIRKRDLAGAEQQLREALRCRPRFALAEARLAQALDETNRSSEARAMAKRAISDGPDLAEGFYIYAQIERRLGNTAEAQRAMNHFNVLQSEGEQSLIAPAIQ